MIELAKPFERCYWVRPGDLLAGYYPGSPEPLETHEKLWALLDAGILTFVNLMEPDEVDHDLQRFVRYAPPLHTLARDRGLQVRTHRFPVPDAGVPTRETMRDILDTIDRSIASGRPVYVHCWGGVGRTGTVVGCWLVEHGLATREDVFFTIAGLRATDPMSVRPAPESNVQRQFVQTWGLHQAT